jgi:HEAT repeat protein
MPVTMEQVREKLEPIEPDYTEAATLGPDAMPFLEQLANDADLLFAPRAVHLASLIGGDNAVRLLLNAVRSPVVIMRVQAAAAARNLPKEDAENILLKALDDSDSGVRNFALKSIRAMGAMPVAIQKKIKTLSTSDPEQFIRESSSDLLKMETPSR